MAVQFASTNLGFELGIVMWIFLGWEFTLAEFLGGLLLIAFMWAGLRLFVTRRLEEGARANAQEAQTGHLHPAAGSEGLTWRERVTSVDAWTDVAHNFRADWEMLWKEITIGFLIAGFVGLLPMSFFNGLFLTDAPAWIRLPENVVPGPRAAALGRRDLVLGRDRVHLRGPADHPDPARLPEVLRREDGGADLRNHVR